jgi:hypothetical protein
VFHLADRTAIGNRLRERTIPRARQVLQSGVVRTLAATNTLVDILRGRTALSMAAAISNPWRQAWPRMRIQTTIAMT